MKLLLSILIFSFISIKSIACSCSPPNVILEFYASKYVFEGEIIAKDYAKDSLTYTLTFHVLKHYKDGDHPEYIKFIEKSEGKYVGIFTSCDESYLVGEKLMVFARVTNEKLWFGTMCSNSSRYFPKRYLDLIQNANQFKLGSHIFNYDFNSLLSEALKPLINVDSIFHKKNLVNIPKNDGCVIMFDVDTLGKTIRLNVYDNNFLQLDSTGKNWGLFQVINQEPARNLTSFEKQILKSCKKIKKWPITYFKPTYEKVNNRKYLTFYIDKNQKLKWTPMVLGIN
jgi:hypothetical protein